MTHKHWLIFVCVVFFFSACAPPEIPPALALPADGAASQDARVELAFLSDLSNIPDDGVISGQNLGHGTQVFEKTGVVGYDALVKALEQQTGEIPGVLGLDYEHDRIYSADELRSANQVLIDHWQRGGLVTVNWSPLNPWLNDESDLINHPGSWSDTRNAGENLRGVDLRQLVDPQSKIYPIWRSKLNRVAAALQNLQEAGVVVLWRPMQEMNGNWFWWGNATSPNDPAPYIAVWHDMFQYFTVDKGLHNLLWVYSPNPGPKNWFEQAAIKPVTWAYPGERWVDVVAGTAYNDALDIADYQTYRSFGKPLGMAEYGPTIGGANSLNGIFDVRLYAERLRKDYPAIAYWVSWHNWDVSAGVQEHQAIVSNQHTAELMQNPNIIKLKHPTSTPSSK